MSIIRGVIPVAPTVFTEDEQLDLTGQRRVVDYLVDGKSDAICILANYSEQFSLTDEERDSVLVSTLDQAAGEIPVCVTTSHFSVHVAIERSLRAKQEGAAMIMLMAPFFGATMRFDDDTVVGYFKRVADAVDIDIMIQDAPLSTTPISASLLARLAKEIPQVKYAKIEMPQAAAKLRELIAESGEDLPGPFDGEEAITLIPDLDEGAQGTMSSSMVPDELGQIVRNFHEGERDKAVAQWENLLPFIHFENRQCGLRASKVLMKEGGIIRSDKSRAPVGPLHPRTRSQLLDMARRRNPLVLRWA